MEYFAGYGFNKSHSTAYAFLAYQTAYLKANYPWHFAAALLTIESQNTDKLAIYLGECRERGVPVLPPDINTSQWHFSVEPGLGVRFGLGALKGLGETAVEAIVAARAQLGGRIASLHQLCEILDLRIVNKRVFEALVKSGACDGLNGAQEGEPRRSLRARLAVGHRRGLRARQPHAAGPGPRAGRSLRRRRERRRAGDQRLAARRSGLDRDRTAELREGVARACIWSGHPVDRYATDLAAYGAKAPTNWRHGSTPIRTPAAGARQLTRPRSSGRRRQASTEAIVGGIVNGLRPLKTRKGDRMCVFMLDDARGSVEVVVFPETFKQWGHMAENGRMVVVTGKLERDDESARILATEVAPIEVLTERLSTSVAITVITPPHDRATVERLWDVLSHHKGDRCLALTVETRPPLRPMRVRLDVHNQFRVRPSESLVADIERVCGQGAVTLGKTPRARA